MVLGERSEAKASSTAIRSNIFRLYLRQILTVVVNKELHCPSTTPAASVPEVFISTAYWYTSCSKARPLEMCLNTTTIKLLHYSSRTLQTENTNWTVTAKDWEPCLLQAPSAFGQLCAHLLRERPALDAISQRCSCQLLLQKRNRLLTSLFNVHTAVLTFFSTETLGHQTLLVQWFKSFSGWNLFTLPSWACIFFICHSISEL